MAVRSNVGIQHVPHWTTVKSYVCPRRIRAHMGDKSLCKRRCPRSPKDQISEYEELPEVQMVRIKEITEFNPNVLFAKARL